MTADQQDADAASVEDVATTFRLAVMAERHPALRRAEARARLRLAAAIQAMDEAGSVPGRHDLGEQAAVELASQRYSRALADLVRGETGPTATPEAAVV
ncbi:hypothetical protein C8K30_1011061 [Promicromonospora sp. AC04]|uniref:hypothetical protein n=1 Tax=Promicromonospora sp. AC04 TaxID=2135723 RepID=UPI000D38F719|nr:hypothetical protein [Promicromonospora sp. AC04]PUB32535.1 hypothetical protein C8K30_1011061 [Promicromonospora sp. AC04]